MAYEVDDLLDVEDLDLEDEGGGQSSFSAWPPKSQRRKPAPEPDTKIQTLGIDDLEPETPAAPVGVDDLQPPKSRSLDEHNQRERDLRAGETPANKRGVPPHFDDSPQVGQSAPALDMTGNRRARTARPAPMRMDDQGVTQPGSVRVGGGRDDGSTAPTNLSGMPATVSSAWTAVSAQYPEAAARVSGVIINDEWTTQRRREITPKGIADITEIPPASARWNRETRQIELGGDVMNGTQADIERVLAHELAHVTEPQGLSIDQSEARANAQRDSYVAPAPGQVSPPIGRAAAATLNPIVQGAQRAYAGAKQLGGVLATLPSESAQPAEGMTALPPEQMKKAALKGAADVLNGSMEAVGTPLAVVGAITALPETLLGLGAMWAVGSATDKAAQYAKADPETREFLVAFASAVAAVGMTPNVLRAAAAKGGAAVVDAVNATARPLVLAGKLSGEATGSVRNAGPRMAGTVAEAVAPLARPSPHGPTEIIAEGGYPVVDPPAPVGERPIDIVRTAMAPEPSPIQPGPGRSRGVFTAATLPDPPRPTSGPEPTPRPYAFDLDEQGNPVLRLKDQPADKIGIDDLEPDAPVENAPEGTGKAAETPVGRLLKVNTVTGVSEDVAEGTRPGPVDVILKWAESGDHKIQLTGKMVSKPGLAGIKAGNFTVPEAETVAPPETVAKGPSRGESPVTADEAPKHEFSSTQATVIGESRKAIVARAEAIPDVDLAEKGRELAPHITALFGLKPDTKPEAVQELLKDEPPITAKLGKTKVFPATAERQSDVVYVDVESPDLARLNEKLKGLPHEDTNKGEYRPHVSLAYVVPGAGKKYAGDDSLAGMELSFDKIVFSTPEGKSHVVELRGTKQASGSESKASVGSAKPDRADVGAGAVAASMLGGKEDLEVLDPIVRAIPVDVVNMLGGKQRATEMVLHDPAMLARALSSDADLGVPAARDSVQRSIDVVAGQRAELGRSGIPASRSKFAAALKTYEGHLRERLSAFTAKEDLPSASSDVGAAGTRTRAETSSGRVGRRDVLGEGGSTEGADSGEDHGEIVARSDTSKPSSTGKVHYNADRHSIEISFPSKPDSDVLSKLKGAGYRWAKTNKVWYRKLDTAFTPERTGVEEAKAAASALIGVKPAKRPQNATTTPSKAPTATTSAPTSPAERPQVVFKKGDKVEYQDFDGKWYPTEVTADTAPDGSTAIYHPNLSMRPVFPPGAPSQRTKVSAEQGKIRAVEGSEPAKPKPEKKPVTPQLPPAGGGTRYGLPTFVAGGRAAAEPAPTPSPETPPPADLSDDDLADALIKREEQRKAERAERAKLMADLRAEVPPTTPNGAGEPQLSETPSRNAVVLMVKILRSYIREGVTDFEQAAQAFQEEYGAGARALDSYFEDAWAMLRGETRSVAQALKGLPTPPETPIVDEEPDSGEAPTTAPEAASVEDRPLVGGEGAKPGTRRPDGRRTGASGSRAGAGPRAPRPELGSGEGTGESGDAAAGPVGGGREVRPDAVTEGDAEPALSRPFYSITEPMRASVLQGQPQFHEAPQGWSSLSAADQVSPQVRRRELQRLWNSMDGGVFDAGERLTPAELNALIETPAVRRVWSTMVDIAEAVGAKVGVETRHVQSLDARSYGFYFHNPADEEQTVVAVNPFEQAHTTSTDYRRSAPAAAYHGIVTILHEYAHALGIRGHGPDFEETYQAIIDAMGDDFIRGATSRLAKDYDGNPDDPNALHPDFSAALSLYTAGRGRRARTDDDLRGAGRYEPRSTDEPGGEEPDARRAGLSRARALAAKQRVLDTLTRDPGLLRTLIAPALPSPVAKTAAGTMRPHIAARDQKLLRLEGLLADIKASMDYWSHEQSMLFWDVMEELEKPSRLNDEDRQIADTFRTILNHWTKEVTSRGLIRAYIENYWPHEWNREGVEKALLRRIFGRRPLAGPESFRKRRSIPTTREGIEMGLEPVSWNPAEQLQRKVTEMSRSVMAYDMVKDLKRMGLYKFAGIGKAQRAMRQRGWVPDKDRGMVYGPRAFEVEALEGHTFENAAGEDVEIPEGTPVVGKPSYGRLVVGQFYMPREVARLMENHLSPGLYGRSVVYDAFRGASNAFTQVLLGWSSFHAWLTGLEYVISKGTLGVEELARGETKYGLKDLGMAATGPYALAKGLQHGWKAVKDFYGDDARAEALTDAIGRPIGLTAKGKTVSDRSLVTQGGGGFTWADIEQSQHWSKFQSDVRGFIGDLERGGSKLKAAGKAVPKAAFHGIGSVVEFPTRMIMTYWVPSLKAAAYLDMMRMEMRRLGPNADLDTIRQVATERWNQVDYRFGQLRHANLFWNNVFKQTLTALFLSVTWNVGSLALLGGAIPLQAVRIAKNLRTLQARRAIRAAAGGGGGMPPPEDGTGAGPSAEEPSETPEMPPLDPWLHPTMAWFLTGATVVFLMSAIYQYVMTGEGPKEPKDLWTPRDGTFNQDGRPNRVFLISYAKDAFAWVLHPLTTLGHKLNALVNLLWDVYRNEDYFGVEVYDPNDPKTQQIEEVFIAALQRLDPIAWKNAGQRAGETATFKQRLYEWAKLQSVPFTPAPAEFERSKAENLLRSFGERDKTVKSLRQAEKSALTREIRQGVRAGTSDGQQAVQDAIGSGQLTPGQVKLALKSGAKQETFLQFGVTRLSLEKALDVYVAMTPHERASVWGIMVRKAVNAFGARGTVPQADRETISARWADVQALPRTP